MTAEGTVTPDSTRTGVCFSVAARRVAVVSGTPAVVRSCAEYLGAWWPNTGWTDAPADRAVRSDVDGSEYLRLKEMTLAGATRATTLLRAAVLYRRLDDGGAVAWGPDEQVAYHHDARTGTVTIAGVAASPVGLVTARLVRESVRAVLEHDGWAVMHASAVVRDGVAVVTAGPKGAGKTTTALSLSRHGWRLLANDRLFARVSGDQVELVPWPAAAAFGLGILDAYGLYDRVRERVLDGEELHASQDPLVTEAIVANRREPLWHGGRELKAQLSPTHLVEWCGFALASAGRVGLVFNPRVVPDGTPSVAPSAPSLSTEDFFQGDDELYPDFLGLAVDPPGGKGAAYDRVRAGLRRLPGATGVLSHDPDATFEALRALPTLFRAAR